MTALRTLRPSVFRWTLCLAILPATACQEAGSLGPANSEDAGPVVSTSRDALPVPFKGTLAATERVFVNPPPAGCQLYLQEAEAGELAHLGRFTGTLTICAFNGQFGVIDPPFNPGGGPPPYLVTDFAVEATYTAANGDLLSISGTGVLVQSLVDGGSGFVGTGAVEGGTGRFLEASGEFDVIGAAGEVSYDGWVVYDASNRSE